MTWKDALATQRCRWALLFSFAVLLMMVLYMPTFYQEIIGPKKGYYLDDPFLKLFKPMDWSLLIFAVLYVSVIQTLATAFRKPQVMLIGLTTYCAISVIRMGTMYMLTLEPPISMILLIDPVTASLVYPDTSFAKDLFFSGHVSTMMVFVLVEENKTARFLKIIGTSLVALLLAWQQVHYTLDLVAAPFVTVAVYALVRKILSLSGSEVTQSKTT
jgi:hypothetical protein